MCSKNTYIIQLAWIWLEVLQAAFVGNVVLQHRQNKCAHCVFRTQAAVNPRMPHGWTLPETFQIHHTLHLEIIFGHCTFKNLLPSPNFWWLHIQLLCRGHDPQLKQLYSSLGLCQVTWHRESLTLGHWVLSAVWRALHWVQPRIMCGCN